MMEKKRERGEALTKKKKKKINGAYEIGK